MAWDALLVQGGGPPSTPSRRKSFDLVEREFVMGRAKFACDPDLALDDEVAEILFRQGFEHMLDPLARAAAARLELLCRIDAHAILMEKAEEKRIRIELGRDELGIGGR